MNRTSWAFAALLVLIGTAFLVGCGAGPVPAPTSYSAFNSKGGTFALDYPDGWTVASGAGRGPE